MINKIDYNTGQYCLDFIKYEPSGIISLEGWSFEETVNNFGLFINEIRVDNFSIFRTLRCDVSISHQYEKALKELARTASHLLITVPDISAIPRCFPANIVPWHLLESTHVNFFTINSFKKCLSRYYKDIKLFKIGRIIVNECSFYNSLVAICSR